MPGLSASELAIVVFILLLVIVAGRLPRWGEALGSYLYRRGNPAPAQEAPPASHGAGSVRPPTGSGSTEQGPTSQVPPPH
jgi:hypothetical protein